MKTHQGIRQWLVRVSPRYEVWIRNILDDNHRRLFTCSDGKKRFFWSCVSIKGALDLLYMWYTKNNGGRKSKVPPVEIWGIDSNGCLKRRNLDLPALLRYQDMMLWLHRKRGKCPTN